jgi:hypothetical protein
MNLMTLMNQALKRKYSVADRFYVPINTAPATWWAPVARAIIDRHQTTLGSGV